MSAGFYSDDVGADRAHYQRRTDPCMNVSGIHRPVKEQDADEFTSPVGVAVDPAGGGPESLVRAGKRPGLPRPRQSSRAW